MPVLLLLDGQPSSMVTRGPRSLRSHAPALPWEHRGASGRSWQMGNTAVEMVPPRLRNPSLEVTTSLPTQNVLENKCLPPWRSRRGWGWCLEMGDRWEMRSELEGPPGEQSQRHPPAGWRRGVERVWGPRKRVRGDARLLPVSASPSPSPGLNEPVEVSRLCQQCWNEVGVRWAPGWTLPAPYLHFLRRETNGFRLYIYDQPAVYISRSALRYKQQQQE